MEALQHLPVLHVRRGDTMPACRHAQLNWNIEVKKTMNEKTLKLLCGSILYDLAQSGYEGNFVKYIDGLLFIEFDNKYLKDFYFIFADSSNDDNAYRLTLYVVPKTVKDFIVYNLDSWCALKFYVTTDEDGNLIGSVNINDIISFLNSFKRNYKKYFYMALIRMGSTEKLPKRKTVNAFYKKYKPMNS